MSPLTSLRTEESPSVSFRAEVRDNALALASEQNGIYMVDIDSTLYPFYTAFSGTAERLYGKPQNYSKQTSWSLTAQGLTQDEVAIALNEIHKRQNEYEPYLNAVKVVNAWYDEGKMIVIVSARGSEYTRITCDWLHTKGFKYHGCLIGYRKDLLLMNPDMRLVIDDCPAIQYRAKEFGYIVATLKHPWIDVESCDIIADNWNELYRRVRKVVN